MSRPFSRATRTGAILLLAGLSCLPARARSNTAVPQPPPCRPTSATLPHDATLAGAHGRYQVTLAAPAGGMYVTGALTLVPSPPGREALGPAATPLQGATDIDLRAVGAFPIGDPAATDPQAPGVLVLEFQRDGERHILLRLGSDANRRGELLYDGGHTVLHVHEIGAGGFAGTWDSQARSSFAKGHFCATRE